MANTILITANWHTGALSQQTISRQYDNNRYVVQFVGYPEASEGNELDYYLLVWMSSAPGEKPDEIAPIQLASDQWYISNVFTQQTQQIKFQMCALNTEGTFEAHSPIFTGFVRNSLEHDGTTQDIDVSTLFDAYREYLNELIIRSGAVVIDSVPTQGSTNAVQSGGVKSALDALQAQIPPIDPTISQSGQAADAKVVGDEIEGVKSNLNVRIDYADKRYDVVSRNLFNKDTVVYGKKLNATSGKVEYNTSIDNFISQKITIKPSTPYYANRNACIYNSSGTFLEFHNISNGSNFTTPAESAYLIVTSTRSNVANTMVAEGSSISYDAYTEAIKKDLVRTDATLAQPDMPANAEATGNKIAETKNELLTSLDTVMGAILSVESTSGTVVTINDSAVDFCKSVDTQASSVYRCGTNLWNEEWELGNYRTDGSPGVTTTNVRSKSTSPIPIKPNTEYYILSPYNTGMCFYDADDVFIPSSMITGNNKAFTSPSSAYYMRFYLVGGYGTIYNNDIQISFNTDSEKTTYHAGNTQLVTNTSELKLIPSNRNYVYAVGSNDVVTIEYYTHTGSGGSGNKRPYEAGFITFTVPSRLTKSNNTIGVSSVSELADDSTNVNCILKLPTTYTPDGTPTKLIMICHGAGQSAQQWATNTNYIALVTAFTNAGYAVFDCNGYQENVLGYSFWGDSRGVDVWRKAYQYVVDNYNVEQVFGLYGFSMGGLTALNLAFSGFPGIKCIALGSPVVSLEACYNSESVNAVIKVLYSMGNTYNPALAYGCDPYARIITINNQKYIFGTIPPIKMWYGSTETGTTDTGTGETVTGVVVKAYGEDIVEAINNAGGQAEYREVDGAGHEICYGGNSVVNNDLVLYFDRHNKI